MVKTLNPPDWQERAFCHIHNSSAVIQNPAHRIQERTRLPKPTRTFTRWIARAACAVVGLLCLAGARIEAADNGTNLFELSLEELGNLKVATVYGASKREQEITSAPAAVSIVTEDQIKKQGYRTLADILNSVRGLYVTYNRGYSFLGVRGLNLPGDYGGRNLILVDGHRMNEPLFDTAALGNDFILDVDLIDRVEVIRGPGSVLYGNNAMFSVVNVITKRGRDFNCGEVSVAGGSFDTYQGRFSVGHQLTNGLEALFSGSFMESDGESRIHLQAFNPPAFPNGGAVENLDGESAQHFFTKWSYSDFTLEAAYSSRHKDVPHGAYEYLGTVFNERYETTDKQAFVDLKFERKFEDDWSVLGRVNYNQYVYDSYSINDYNFTGNPADYVLNYDWSRARWFGAEAQVSKQLGARILLTGGAEYRNYFHERYQNEDIDPPAAPYASVDQSASTWGVFADAEFQICQTNLTLDAGVRYDGYSEYDSAVNPRASLIARPFSSTVFKLLYGEAYRVPNVYEVYYSGQPSTSLQPETAHTYEAVWEQQLGRHFRTSVGGYYNDIDDVISRVRDFGADPNDRFYPDDTIHVINRHIQSHGVEFELEGLHASGLRGRASYAWQESRDQQLDEDLINSPHHLVKFNLEIPVYRDKVFTGLEARYQSNVDTVYGTSLSPFWVVNITLFSAKLAKGLEVSASIYNLLDEDYSFPGGPEHSEDRIPQPGRTFRLKLAYRF